MIIRKARITDVEHIHGLINYYAEHGQMLARARSLLYEGIREFAVAEMEGKIIGCGSLHILWEDLAEVRALAVAPDFSRQGVGKQLVRHFLAEAKELGIARVFALTYKPAFFARCGFYEISKDRLDRKVWKECINCPQFPNCTESAVLIDLIPGGLN